MCVCVCTIQCVMKSVNNTMAFDSYGFVLCTVYQAHGRARNCQGLDIGPSCASSMSPACIALIIFQRRASRRCAALHSATCSTAETSPPRAFILFFFLAVIFVASPGQVHGRRSCRGPLHQRRKTAQNSVGWR